MFLSPSDIIVVGADENARFTRVNTQNHRRVTEFIHIYIYMLLTGRHYTEIVSGAQGDNDRVSALDHLVHVFFDQDVARHHFDLVAEFFGHSTGIPEEGPDLQTCVENNVA